jgi:isocitrate lyase
MLTSNQDLILFVRPAARTDAEAANLLMTNIDVRDHPFIMGVTNPNLRGQSVVQVGGRHSILRFDQRAGPSHFDTPFFCPADHSKVQDN